MVAAKAVAKQLKPAIKAQEKPIKDPAVKSVKIMEVKPNIDAAGGTTGGAITKIKQKVDAASNTTSAARAKPKQKIDTAVSTKKAVIDQPKSRTADGATDAAMNKPKAKMDGAIGTGNAETIVGGADATSQAVKPKSQTNAAGAVQPKAKTAKVALTTSKQAS